MKNLKLQNEEEYVRARVGYSRYILAPSRPISRNFELEYLFHDSQMVLLSIKKLRK